MVHDAKRIGALVLRLILGLALLGCPRLGSAQGTWSVISLPQQPGDVLHPAAVAVDAAGNLYVADYPGWPYGNERIQKRDIQGNWSILATYGRAAGEIVGPSALAVDTAGNLYVAADGIQKRDTQGNWSVIATHGSAPGQVDGPSALAVDNGGNLYVADIGNGWIQERDAQGNWSVIAFNGTTIGQVNHPTALAVDSAGDLYVADQPKSPYGSERIQKRDTRGNWLVITVVIPAADSGIESSYPRGLAVDAEDNLYLADTPVTTGSFHSFSRIQKRDAEGHWSVLATSVPFSSAVGVGVDAAGDLFFAESRSFGKDDRIQKRDARGNWTVIAIRGTAPGQFWQPGDLAVDTAGNLYVSDYDRIQKRDAQGNWSVIAARGAAPGQVIEPRALAVGTAGDLYVGDLPNNNGRIQKRDAQGNWSAIATQGASALAVDADANLYVADYANNGRIQKRDAQGNWSILATFGSAPGQVSNPLGLALDTAGNLYVSDGGWPDYNYRIQKRDTRGNWSAIADRGSDLGQVWSFAGLAVDATGHLYVADTGNQRVQKYTPHP